MPRCLRSKSCNRFENPPWEKRIQTLNIIYPTNTSAHTLESQGNGFQLVIFCKTIERNDRFSLCTIQTLMRTLLAVDRSEMQNKMPSDWIWQ